MEKQNKTKGILATIGCFLLLFCGGGIVTAAFGLHIPYICAENGFTNTQATSLITVRTLVSIVVMIYSTVLVKKLGHRLANTLAFICAAIGFFLFSISSSYPVYLIGVGLAGVGFTMATVGVPMLLNGWFSKGGLGTALGIATTASGIASIIMPKVLVPIFETQGLAAGCRLEAIFIAICGVIFYLIVRNPEEQAVENKTEEVKVEVKENVPEFDIPKGLVAVLFGATVVCGLTIIGTTSGLAALFSELYTPEQMSTLTALYGAALMVGKIVYGRLSDTKGVYISNYIYFALLIVGLAVAALVNNYTVALVAAICIGLGATLGNLGTPSLARALATKGQYDKAVKNLSTVMSVGGMIAGILVGAVADAAGTYVAAFIMLALAATISAVCIQGIFLKTGKK